MALEKIPTTVITGFLGAGKTTLIRHLLKNAKGRRIALVINEFGDIGVDGEILKGCGEDVCREEDVVELANGCICCTVADDFIPTMRKLLDREKPPEHIVIETSGLALPIATPSPACSIIARSFRSSPIAMICSGSMPWCRATCNNPAHLFTDGSKTSSTSTP